MKRGARKQLKRLARLAAEQERREDVVATTLTRELAEAPYRTLLEDQESLPSVLHDPEVVLKRTPRAQRALLIVNSKSGPKADSLLKVREIAEVLARLGIAVDVRVKLKKSLAWREARRAARRGTRLVIAAGGDGTVAAVARGLVGTRATLGVIPMGTYNNLATSLGIPKDMREACALIAEGAGRWIDVGEVTARGRKKPVMFLEIAAVGLAGALMPIGQHFEKGRWQQAFQALPAALRMSPTFAMASLDDAPVGIGARTLLLLVANGPRAGAGLDVAPSARMDDGLLDVYAYPELDQKGLAAKFIAISSGVESMEKDSVMARARTARVDSAAPLPVIADSRLVGITPATFRVRPAALRVIAGNGAGLSRPVSASLLQATATIAHALPTSAETGDLQSVPVEPRMLRMPDVSPAVANVVERARAERSTLLPVALAAVGGGLLVPLLRRLTKR